MSAFKVAVPAEAIGANVSEQDVVESKAAATVVVVKSIALAEAIGAGVSEQDVVESRAAATALASLKVAVPAEAIGAVVL